MFAACSVLIKCLTFNSLFKLYLTEPKVLDCAKKNSSVRKLNHYEGKYGTKYAHLFSVSLKTSKIVLGVANNIPYDKGFNLIPLMPYFTIILTQKSQKQQS